MRINLAPDVCIVMAMKDGAVEYWAATTRRDEAVAAVEKKLSRGWSAILTKRHLTMQRAGKLRMRPDSVQKL